MEPHFVTGSFDTPQCQGAPQTTCGIVQGIVFGMDNLCQGSPNILQLCVIGRPSNTDLSGNTVGGQKLEVPEIVTVCHICETSSNVTMVRQM